MMRRLVTTIGLTSVLAGVVVVWAQQPNTTLPNPPKPGRFTLVLKSGGYERLVHVHIPKGYQSGDKPPLVLLLHGGGGRGTIMIENNGWVSKADQEGFLVVAPDGLPAAPRFPANFIANPVVWNSGQLNPRSPRAAIDDVAFVKLLLNELKDKIPFDENRVYCAGHSNGGGMALKLAAEIPECFTAFAMVGGLMAVEDPKPKKPLPTLYILGTKDPYIPMEGGEVKTPWTTRKHPPIAEPLAQWAKAIGCQSEPTVISQQGGIKKVEYPSRDKGPSLTVLYIEGQGHNWPGAPNPARTEAMGPITSKLNATNEIWDFFRSKSDKKK